jgi:antitoxin CcdA
MREGFVMANSTRVSRAAKRAVNLSIDAELLAEARGFGLSLSGLLEERLSDAVREARRKAWLAENAEAIEDYNSRIDTRGSYADSVRRF